MKLISSSVRETVRIGRIIGENLRKGDIVCLSGGLGAGKTVLAKGIAQGLGGKAEQVMSPTFVLIREYKARIPMYHFDLYRLDKHSQMQSLGFDEYFFGEGVSVIEWADKLEVLLPAEFIRVVLTVHGAQKRMLQLEAVGKRYKTMMDNTRRSLRKRVMQ